MNNSELQSIVNNGIIFLDSRCLKDEAVCKFLTNLTLTLNRLGLDIKIQLLIGANEHESSYNKVVLSYDDTDFDLSYFFHVHSKVNFKFVTEDTIKVIFGQTKDVLFITSDQKTAFDVSNLTCDNKIYIRRLSNNVVLEPFPMISNSDNNIKLFSYILGRSPRIDKISFNCKLPKTNDIVFINDKEYKLKKQLGLGGEGIVYELDDEIVAKIFFNERLTKTRTEKINLMVKKRINDYGICWPIDLIKNNENYIIGYTMKRCFGKPISTLYRGPIVTQQLYPDYTVTSSIELTIKILQKIKKLHQNNVLLGDINDRNFLIHNTEEVFLIDTDSYQFEDYSCDVGTIGYIAPELKDGMLATTLRTFEDESYGIAVFVFRTLMQGYFPFAQVGKDKDYVQLIKQQQFPYSLNVKKTKKKVPLLAYECWETFSPLLMKMFINTFSNNKIQKRYSVDEWIIALENHLNTCV